MKSSFANVLTRIRKQVLLSEGGLLGPKKLSFAMDKKSSISRKEFLAFFGRASFALLFWPLATLCRARPINKILIKKHLGFAPLKPNAEDKLLLAEGFDSYVLIRWGEPLNSKDNFGFNNDYLTYLNLRNTKNEVLLWANHEAPDPLFVSGFSGAANSKKKSQVIKEQLSVGASIVHIKKNVSKNKWEYTRNHRLNRRLDARTKIPFFGGESGAVSIQGSRSAIGTLGNCSGGITPWNTILTCEENYGDFYGDYKLEYKGTKRRRVRIASSTYFWDKFYKYPPEHYGWVVETDPFTARAKKLISLGRFCHEGATVVPLKDGRVVVYMGDDDENECLYKFIARKAGSLREGELFVANLTKGVWIPLNYKKQKKLQDNFQNQREVLSYARQAAHILGGTPLDRPEDIAVDPKTGNVIVALTNNKTKVNLHGSLLKIEEEAQNPLSFEI